jgi:hypothetical protein
MGAEGSYVADVAIFGTRRAPRTNAGDAESRLPASGVGLHSVWQGPRKILGGAPVLRRNKTA